MPAGQFVWLVGLVQYLPAGQVPHADSKVEAGGPNGLAVGQFVQLDTEITPVAALYVFAGHGVCVSGVGQ